MPIQPQISEDGLHRICTTLCIGLSALWLGAGCSDKDDSAAPDPLCEGDTALTYDTFGEGFFTQYCQGCHASTTAERYGAPADVTQKPSLLRWPSAAGIHDHELLGPHEVTVRVRRRWERHAIEREHQNVGNEFDPRTVLFHRGVYLSET